MPPAGRRLLPAFSARRDGDVVRLEDAKTQTVVSVVRSRGNTANDMRVKGKKVLYTKPIEQFLPEPQGGTSIGSESLHWRSTPQLNSLE